MLRFLALLMNICWKCLSVVLPMKHLARTARQQPEPRWQLNRLIISTQNSDAPRKHCGATLALCTFHEYDATEARRRQAGSRCPRQAPVPVFGVQMGRCSCKLPPGGNNAFRELLLQQTDIKRNAFPVCFVRVCGHQW